MDSGQSNLGKESRRVYRFGEFEVDLHDESIRRGHEKLPINRRTFQVLCLLIERRGEIVTKSEFFENVWNGSFVEDNNLTVAITQLRKVLGDKAKDANFIENIPRKGYRFIGDVERGPTEGDSETTNATKNERPSTQRFLVIGAVISLLIVLSLGFASISGVGGNSMSKISVKQQTIAVMPFKFRDPESEYLTAGLTDGISRSLGRNSALRVSDKKATFALNDYADRPLDAASRLGIENVVFGEVERSDGGLIVIAKMVNVNDPSTVWKRQFRRTEADLFATQQEIVAEIFERLNIDNSGAKPENARDPKALEFYMKGQYYLNRRTEADFQRSVELFKQTVDLDPTFSQAYVGLSEAYTLGAFVEFKFAPGEKNALIRANIQKALDIDPNLGEAYAARAINRCYYDWDFAGAESDYRRAIELVPSNATAHHWYAEFLSMEGRFDESYREYDKAISLDPLSMAVKTDLALAHFYARDYDSAMEMLNKVKSIDPDFLRTDSYVYWIYRVKGEYGNGIDVLERFHRAEISKGNRVDSDYIKSRLFGLRDGLERKGAKGYWEAESRMEKFDAALGAHAYAQLGDKDKAIALLEAAFEKRSSGLVWLKVEPLLDPLRDDPRFADLMTRVGFVK